MRRWLGRVARWAGAALLLLLAVLLGVGWTRGNDCDGQRAPGSGAMRAVVHCEYGPSEVLRVEPRPRPVPADDELLVRVRAASLNPVDWHAMRGTPYVMRLGAGLRVPADTRLGVDFAGTVEAVGSKVTRFRPGDEVFGGRSGALADYVTVRESRAVARKPPAISFEQAAGVSVAAVTALQGLRDRGGLRPGQKVLVNGASGGVGTFAVQIAKALGAEVTGVCSSRNVELVRSLGADHVVDYTREDFTRGEARYDLILDNVGNHGLLELRGTLRPGGRYVMIGGPKGTFVDPLPRALWAALVSLFVAEDMGMMLAQVNQQDLLYLGGLMEAGKVRPVVDRSYPLADLPEAMRYLETGRARGKVIVSLER